MESDSFSHPAPKSLYCFFFMATRSAALARLLMLCYEFSINPLHNRGARSLCCLQTERLSALVAVSSSKIHPTPSYRKVTNKKDKEKKGKKQPASQFFSSFQDKEMGKLKGCICSVTAEEINFLPLGLVWCPQLNAERLLEWKGGMAVFHHLKKGLDGSGRCSLSMDTRLESRGVDGIRRA